MPIGFFFAIFQGTCFPNCDLQINPFPVFVLVTILHTMGAEYPTRYSTTVPLVVGVTVLPAPMIERVTSV